MEIVEFSGKILCQSHLHLGEGPTYDPHTGTAYWFDILNRELHELHVSSGRKIVHALPVMGSVLARIDAARQLIVADTGLFVRDVASGELTMLVTVEDNPSNRSNDGRVHPSGALWTSTMGRNGEKGVGAIYHVAGTTVTKLVGDLTTPNAICFSPDGSAGFYVDTGVNKIMRVPLDPDTGLPVGEATVFSDQSNGEGGVDGAISDLDGNLWSARWGEGAIDRYSPDGTHVARYTLPASQGSCPAFFGESADRIFVTSAWEGMTDEDRRHDPAAGQTFDLGITVRGKFEPAFKL